MHQSVPKFLASLDAKTHARALQIVSLLEEIGGAISMPHSKALGDGLFELRVRSKTAHVRLLYGFCKGGAVIVVGMVKKRQALAKCDISLARERLELACR